MSEVDKYRYLANIYREALNTISFLIAPGHPVMKKDISAV